MKIFNRLILSFVVAGSSIVFAGELKSIWQKAYGGSKKDIAYSSVQLNDGSIFLAGESKSWGKGKSDMLIIKCDSNGNPKLRITFGEKERESAKAIAKTSDGNLIVAGSTESFSDSKDVYVVKFTKDGKKLWSKHFGGADDDDEALAIAPTSNGGAIIVGWTESYGSGYKDGYLIYLDKNGNKMWEKAVGGKDDDVLTSIAFSKAGGFFVAGYTSSYGDNGQDFYVVKFDSKAHFKYKRAFGGENDEAINSIVATDDGGVVTAGWTESFDSKHKDIDVMKLNKDAKLVWHKIFGFKSQEWANSVTKAKDGGFVVAGTTKSFGFGSYDFYILRLNSKGSSQWANVFGGDARDEAFSAITLKDGEYLVSGKTKSYGKGDFDFMYMKLKDR